MTIKVFDTFDGVDGVDISNHTPDIDIVGGGWSQISTSGLELDGAGALKLTGTGERAWIDAGTPDQWGVISFKSDTGTAQNDVGIMLRRDVNTDSTRNGYKFFISANQDTVKINKIVNGVNTTLVADSAYPLTESTTYSLEPEIDGSSLDFIIDGISAISVTDTTHTTGGQSSIENGIISNTNARIFDFQISDAAPVVGGINVFRRRMIMKKSA